MSATLTRELPVDQLRQQAAAARPGRSLAQLIATVFVALGWVAGTAVSGVIFCALAVRYGYRIGRGRDPLTGQAAGAAAAAPGP